MGTESFGQYQLLEVLGRGGMGEVFRAYDASTDRVVALKVLPPNLAEDREFQHRFRREARIAASLNDPHVVPIHSFGEIDGRLHVDMRLIEGRDLGQYITENGGRLSPERAVAVIEQVAAALDSAHKAGLIHRDIKPKNILVTTARDFVYLIDFGIARAAADTALTHTGHTMGTVAYMAPERFRGHNGSPRRRLLVGLRAARMLDREASLRRRQPGTTAQRALEHPAATAVDHCTGHPPGPRRGGRPRDGEGRR